MKTRHLLAVLAGVALAGCVADNEYEPNLQNEQTKITFGSPVMYDNSNGSRANYHGEIGTFTYGAATRTYPQQEDFIIFAKKYPTNVNFSGWESTSNIKYTLFNMHICKFNTSLDGWTPLPEAEDTTSFYYWPAGMYLTYAACSPYDLEQADDWNGRSYGETGLKLKDFKIPGKSENHFDLLFSKRRYNVSKDDMYGTADKYSGAPIEFQHALTSIHFSLLNETSSTVTLKRIALYGVHDTGTFNENINESKGLDYVRNNDTQREINVTPEWTISSSAVAIQEDNAYEAFKAAEGKAGLTFPESAQYISTLLTYNENKDVGDNFVLLVLPQNIPLTAMLRIDYEVSGTENTVEAHKIVPLNNAPKLDTNTNKPSSDPNQRINKWEIGTKYTYRLVYTTGAEKADKIFFSPSTEGWKDAGVAVIDLASSADAVVTP